MTVEIHFFSWFKELTGCARTIEDIPAGCTLGDLHRQVMTRFPKLAALERSTLIAVGLDYQPREYVLKEGDEVSLFPPVQGG